MTTSHKSAGGGTSSGNAVQSGSETHSVLIAGTESPAVPQAALVDEFDEHIGALDELRILADAGAALARVNAKNPSCVFDCMALFSMISSRCERAAKALDESVAFLVERDTSQRGSVQ